MRQCRRFFNYSAPHSQKNLTMQLPENTPPATPVVEVGGPSCSPERTPPNVTPDRDLPGEFIGLSDTQAY